MTASDPNFDALQGHAVPLETSDPEADPSDLYPLLGRLRDARVVGLGETTHGAREFFQLKHRLIRLLVEELGCRLVGLEGDFAEALPVDDYVRHGEGDPETALRGFGVWPWRTEEVLALVEWLRDFNEGQDHGDRVGFYGFDAQRVGAPAAALREYLATVDPDYLASVGAELDSLAAEEPRPNDVDAEERLAEASDLAAALEDRFEGRGDEYADTTSAAELAVARRHRRVFAQSIGLKYRQAAEEMRASVAHRERAMADNVDWILDHENRDRIALWAHNNHVRRNRRIVEGREVRPMGNYLADRRGNRYYALGFDFGRGAFRALPERADGDYGDLGTCTLDGPPGNSASRIFVDLDDPRFILNLDTAAADPQLADWLGVPRRIHDLGAIHYRDPADNYGRYVLPEAFDGLYFAAEISAAVELGAST